MLGKLSGKHSSFTGVSLPSRGKGHLSYGSLCIIFRIYNPKQSQVSENLFFHLKKHQFLATHSKVIVGVMIYSPFHVFGCCHMGKYYQKKKSIFWKLTLHKYYEKQPILCVFHFLPVSDYISAIKGNLQYLQSQC